MNTRVFIYISGDIIRFVAYQLRTSIKAIAYTKELRSDEPKLCWAFSFECILLSGALQSVHFIEQNSNSCYSVLNDISLKIKAEYHRHDMLL